jgi:ATP-dependent RNA helicase RhlE
MSSTPVTASFDTLGLSEPLLKALAETGYTTPTPIQEKSIPTLLRGKDLLGLAETGTGKTAAFALPLLQRLAAEGKRAAPRTCRALILAPTRELAIQIAESIKTYGKHLDISHSVIFGGVGARPQMRAMERGVDIVVATPGRLLDLIDSRHMRLDAVSCLILDEADRMLDMGFIHDVRKIVKMVPKVRQSLLFSATMPDDIASLAASILHNPERVEVTRTGKTVDRILQSVYFLDNGQKRPALAALLQDPAMKRVIVFTRTKRGADRVSRNLAVAKITAHAIHGNKSQNARQDALEAFRTGKTRVLVATDIAARGIDIDDITHVINYELPNIPESYVHRIGRTARAGTDGVAIALCAPDEKAFLRDIERLTKSPLKIEGKVEGIEKFASLPEAKRSNGSDDDSHFERSSGRIDQGRRNNRPSMPRHDAAPRAEKVFGPRGADRAGRPGGPERGERGGERSFAPRGDRPAHAGAGDRGGDRGGRPSFGDRGPRRDDAGRSAAPRGNGAERPWSNGPRSDAPRGRDGGDRRPPAGGGERREARAPYAGDRPRSDAPRGDVPRSNADRARAGIPREPRPLGDKPQGERRPYAGKPGEGRPRSDFGDRGPKRDFKPREGGKPFGDRGGDRPRPDSRGPRRDDAPRGDRRERSAAPAAVREKPDVA